MIPVFSLERTQELIFEINEMAEAKIIPLMPIFLDSPLAIKLTRIYKAHQEIFQQRSSRYDSKSGDDVFNFPGLKMTEETEESKAILSVPNPKIIMAGSGMSNGGRIVHHEKNYLPNPNDTLLLVGYQSAGTLGRLIQEGVKKLHIQNEEIPVRARIEMISGYSGHKDSDHLVEFVADTAKTVKKVFTVMGEPKAALFLAQKFKDNLGLETESPMAGDTIIIDCK
jgi:metallo-beta-lactamase family protein